MAFDGILLPQWGEWHDADPIRAVEDGGTNKKADQGDDAALLADSVHHGHAGELHERQEANGALSAEQGEPPSNRHEGHADEHRQTDDEAGVLAGEVVLPREDQQGPGLPAHPLESPADENHTQHSHVQPRAPKLDDRRCLLAVRRRDAEVGVRRANHRKALALGREVPHDGGAVERCKGDHQHARRDLGRGARQARLAEGREGGAQDQSDTAREGESGRRLRRGQT
mmetsp:Transcript_89486/g.278481  ORF Transcript_89486/g.278481 Transcript_89486/m.278481 type:complete len:227 (+) Transcript_89486:511-1191(+)